MNRFDQAIAQPASRGVEVNKVLKNTYMLLSATLAFSVLLRGMNDALLDLIEDPPLVDAIMDKGAAIVIEKGKFFTDNGIDILRLNDSVANMSVISPKAWRLAR